MNLPTVEQQRGPTFVPHKTSKEVQRFLRENLEANWGDCLDYVLNRWQQVSQGKIQYLIEGGVAIKILHPNRQEPRDVDVLTRSPRMERSFENAQKIDVKTVAHWFAFRLWPYNLSAFSTKPGEFLLEMNQEATFRDRKVFILSPLGLAVSKTLRYGNRPPRDKDVDDLRLLDQDPLEIQKIIDRIMGAYPRRENW